MKKVLFFCHAPTDVQYILSQIGQNEENEISVVVVNVESIYNFFKRTNIKFKKLLFIPYTELNYRNPAYIINERKRIKDYYRNYLTDYKETEVFFYAIGYDWLSFYFLKRLKLKNKVYYVDYGKPKILPISKLQLTQKFNLLAIWMITGLRLKYFLMIDNNAEVLILDYCSYGIAKIEPYLNREFIKKYVYKYHDIKPPSALILDSNMEGYNIYVNYKTDMKVILDTIKTAGYHIYVKPHPRQGHSYLIVPYATAFLPGEIPSEFLDVSDFTIVIKTDSQSTFTLHRNNIWSVIDLIEYSNKELKQNYKKFIQEMDTNNLHFISTVEELKILLNSLSSYKI